MSDNVGENPEVVLKKDDSFLALGILVGAIVLVLVIVLYLWRVRKIFSSKDERFMSKTCCSFFIFNFT
jgi:hypothetical protein